ncbi:hypothetical protein CONPUDRAFT_70464 [Coniophora puteana RWD-64-598 SS2]|uniref:Uncharacterized protein n=1 Tax=Coniophora puteana (strain RWD-64-598) TaxID=741705 RepID=A0A5M3N2X1_CONPW|nr:uncharacterized protein CONPUDRAFT_70464 [Coniophora puteana RWD-64-598 SS2]EIW85730.1 hypothetical protein CONPUDRAFT_70464 [Coniophora puteana RWD-64-598 SS2]
MAMQQASTQAQNGLQNTGSPGTITPFPSPSALGCSSRKSTLRGRPPPTSGLPLDGRNQGLDTVHAHTRSGRGGDRPYLVPSDESSLMGVFRGSSEGLDLLWMIRLIRRSEHVTEECGVRWQWQIAMAERLGEAVCPSGAGARNQRAAVRSDRTDTAGQRGSALRRLASGLPGNRRRSIGVYLPKSWCARTLVLALALVYGVAEVVIGSIPREETNQIHKEETRVSRAGVANINATTRSCSVKLDSSHITTTQAGQCLRESGAEQTQGPGWGLVGPIRQSVGNASPIDWTHKQKCISSISS